MTFKLRVFMRRARCTVRGYRVMWKPPERGRLRHLRNQWIASSILVQVHNGKIYEVGN